MFLKVPSKVLDEPLRSRAWQEGLGRPSFSPRPLRVLGSSRGRRDPLLLGVFLAAALAGAGCARLGQRRYSLDGVVQQITTSGDYVVAHKDIPGFMPAMTMAFHVKGAKGQIAPGDEIEAALVVTNDSSWLEDVRVKARGLPVAVHDGELRPSGAQVGDLVPAFPLVNQDGQAIGLTQYRPRTLILTFIYTRCPLPEYCPLMMRNFQKLDDALAADPSTLARTHLLSISFDTAHDTPSVLKSFGRGIIHLHPGTAGFSHWEFATGSVGQVKSVADFFGLDYWSEEGQIMHSLCTAIIGPDGKVAKVYRDNEWTVDEALREVRRTLS